MSKVGIDWYERSHELWPDQIFLMHDGSKVRLDHRVPGDGTAWVVVEWFDGGWKHYNRQIEPGDLKERLGDPT